MRETWVWSDVALLLSDELLHFCSQPIPSSFTCPWSMFSFSSPQINLSLNLFPLKCQSPFTLQPITFPKLPSLLFFFFSQFMESLSTQSLKPKTLQLSLSPSLPYQVDHPGLWPVELYFRNILWIHFSAVSSLLCFGSDHDHHPELLQQSRDTSFYQASSILQPKPLHLPHHATTRIIFLKYESSWVIPLLKLWLCIAYRTEAKHLGVALTAHQSNSPSLTQGCCHIDLPVVLCSVKPHMSSYFGSSIWNALRLLENFYLFFNAA